MRPRLRSAPARWPSWREGSGKGMDAAAVLIDPDNVSCATISPAPARMCLDDADAAVELLRPYMSRANAAQMRHVAADPDLDRLRGDPRFQAMLAEAEARIAAAAG